MYTSNVRPHLMTLAALFCSQLSAAPLSAPWEQQNDIGFIGDTVARGGSFISDSIVQHDGQIFLGLAGDAGPNASDECDSVAVYQKAMSPQGDDVLIDVLSRADAGVSCTQEDEFGHDITVLDNDLLVISAPGLASTTPVDNGELYIYERHSNREDGWQFVQRLTGDQFDIEFLGTAGFSSDGQRLYVANSEVSVIPATGNFNIIPTGINVLTRDRNNIWRRQSLINPDQSGNSVVTNFQASGDQLLVTLRDINSNSSAMSLVVFEEQNELTGDWELIQEITAEKNTEAPSNLRRQFIPASISGDWYITRPIEFRNNNDIDGAALVYRRNPEGLWIYHQSIVASAAEAALGLNFSVGVPLFSLLEFDTEINGADLSISWLQSNSQYEVVHYRLNKDEQFEAAQHLFTALGQGRPAPIVDFSDDRIVMVSFEDAIQSFRRGNGNGFLFNRGLTGGWWFGPQRSGQGVGLEVLPNDRVQVVWLTHDLSGRQQWLFGAGEIAVDRVRLQLLQPVGARFGPDFNNSDVQRLPWGEVELVFDSCESGELHYESNNMGSGTLPLFRLSKVDGLDCGDATASPLARRWTGSWFDPTHNGEGQMMHVTTSRDGPRLSSLWMSYNTEGEQAVFYTAANLNSTSLVEFTSVIRPTGLNFDGSGTLQRNPWGRYSIFSGQCDRGILNYNSTDGNFGQGRLNIRRFTRPVGTGCF